MGLSLKEVSEKLDNVVVSYRDTKSFLYFFNIDNPPPLIPKFKKFIPSLNNNNRAKVTHGSIVEHSDDGKIVIIENREGIKAAFWYFELKKRRNRK